VLRCHPRLALFALLLGIAAAGASAVFFWSLYHLHAAGRALEHYDFDAAQHHLELCLTVRPRSPRLHLQAAQTARRRDAYEEAERHLDQATRLGGTTEATLLERSLLSAQQGELEGQEITLRARASEDDAESLLVLEALAKGYASRFWYAQTLVSLNMLLERQPAHPQALLMRAQMWERRARNGEKDRELDALEDYKKAVALRPTFESRVGLAGTLYRVGESWDALCQFKALYQENPTDPEVLLGLARCFFVAADPNVAKRFVDELLALQPNHAAGLLERARLELYAGQMAEAEESLRRSAAAAPRYDFEAQRLLCECLEAEKKTEEARHCRQELAEREAAVLEIGRLSQQAAREPGNVSLRYEIATKLMGVGREDDSIGTLLSILELDPRHRLARQTVIDYFERTGQSRRASRLRLASFPSTGAATPGR
jgi:thioredoxin-like negative regulator of GroEL